MGQLLNASCACGYDEDIALGSTRASHGKFYGYPYLCHSCPKMFTGNLYEESISCSECKSIDIQSYEDKSVRQRKEQSDNALAYQGNMYLGPRLEPEPLQERPRGLLAKVWRRLFPFDVKRAQLNKSRSIILYKKGYLCPSCKCFDLSFEMTAFID